MVAAREGMYFRDLLTELGVPLLGATALRSDNKSVKELSLDSIAFKKTKHILRAAHFLRDLCDRQFFQVIWIAGTQNPADLFTKVLSRQEFEKHRRVVLNLPAAEGIMKQVYERRALENKKEGPSDCSGKDSKKKKVSFKA